MGRGSTVYYGRDRFLVLTPGYALDRRRNPIVRLSYSLFLGCRAPFVIEPAGALPLTTRALLLAPGAARQRITAAASNLAILDIAVDAPEAWRLRNLMNGREMIPLGIEPFEPRLHEIWQAAIGIVSADEIARLVTALIDTLCSPGSTPPLDPRVSRTLRALRTLRPYEFSLDELARKLAISPSRLRHLFRQETGVTLGQTLRSQIVWRASYSMRADVPLTKIAQESGAFDLSHLDRLFVKSYGCCPSALIRSTAVRLIQL